MVSLFIDMQWANRQNIKSFIISHPLLYKVAKRIRKVPKPSKGKIQNSFTYSKWIEECEPSLWGLFEGTEKGPLISVVVPMFNTPNKYLIPLVDALKNQTYMNWELCIADASTDQERATAIRQEAATDKRIVYKKITENKGISGNTNEGIKLARGEYVGLLDHDDILAEHALEEVAIAITHNKDVDIIYSDEDKLSDDGKTRLLPFFKPNWSPDLLLGVNYITHFLIVKKSLLDEVEGLRSAFDGAQDYDLLLRLVEKTDRITHIPKILYHWRLADGSTAKNVGEKNYADDAGQRALQDAIKRRGLSADVVGIPSQPTNYRLKFRLPRKQPKVSIIIPFKDKPGLLRQCVESIEAKTTYKNYEIILVSNNSTEPETHAYLKELKEHEKCRIFYWDRPFNYSRVNNFGRSKAKGDYLILLNNDTSVITPEWVEELVGVASQKGVGEVGALLHYPNGEIQHAGVILGMGTMAGHVFRHRNPYDWTDFGMPSWPRNYLAVTAACVAIKASKYDEVGGLDEVFTVAGNDVALGISLYEKGYRNVYWPFAELVHYENVSVGSYNNGIQLDYDHSLDYYRPYLNWNDPYFNPNLDLMNEQVSPRSRYE